MAEETDGVIDAHVHLCRTPQEAARVFPRPNVPPVQHWATPDDAPRLMAAAGITHIVMLNLIDTRAMVDSRVRRAGASGARADALRTALRDDMRDRVSSFNRWACRVAVDDPRFIACVYIDPVLFGCDAQSELDACHKLGARGVKMQPDVSGFGPDDRSVWPVFELARDLELPIVFDTGSNLLRPDEPPRGRPARFVPMLEAFPDLSVVMAHLGSAFWDERVEIAQRFPNVAFDTSGGFTAPDHRARGGTRALSEEDAARVINKVGAARVMFGSDGPYYDPIPQIAQLGRLALSDEDRRLVFRETARRVFGIES